MIKRLLATLRVGSAYWNARRRRFSSRAALEAWQDRRVQAHLRHVMPRSDYYQQLFHGRSLCDWRDFPTTDKQAMMANFGRFNTLGVGRGEALEAAQQAERTRDFRPTLRGATVGLSSGTSGNAALFLSSTRENCEFIGTALAKLLRDNPFAKHRIAFFHRAHSNLYRGIDSGRIRYAFFDLMEDLEQHFTRLEELSPTLVIGPPFVLRHLGEAKSDQRLQIAPTGILSVAEVLDDADRAQIAADFGVPVDQAYVATEGFIAATCARGSLHVNEDILVMQREWLDREAGRFVPIITDFRRRVQPIIRYRLDDVLVDGKSGCDCGSPFAVLERIDGRCDDVLVFKARGGQQLRRVFPDFVRRAVYLASNNIRDYRVSQDAVDSVVVEMDVDTNDREVEYRAVLASLQETLEQLDCEAPQFVCRPLAPSHTRDKVRRVVRNFRTDLT